VASDDVVIVPYRDGPYLVRGPLVLRDQDGRRIEAGRRTIALCRCGKSRTRPFCDGTHRLVRFQSTSAPADGARPYYSGNGADTHAAVGAKAPASRNAGPTQLTHARAGLRRARAMLAEVLDGDPAADTATALRSAEALLAGVAHLLEQADRAAIVPDITKS
jgi:CDGSH-type Zn-finger protein